MGLTEKAKELADVALEKAGVYSEKAAAKAAELSDVARDKAPGYLDRAAELAGRAVDSAAAGVDKATGGRFHEQIEGASTKVGESLDRARHTTAAPTGVPDEAPGPVIVPPAPPDVAGQAGAPVTPAATNPEATKPDARDTGGTDTGSTPGPKS
ncbi:Rv0909 family putative TA system antitoxin [Pseudonocardia sp.]|uniref:Rv0909 family putative TA system antitoxin n=1 Tax=Pseudonocardia sp. TaxID=60912 RepID=UPI0031FD908B